MSDNPLSTLDRDRIACKLWGNEVLDAQGRFYARSSDEEVALLCERVRELQGRSTAEGVQKIQLDLIRSRRFNEFDGEQIVRTQRSLWVSALMDRLGDPFGLIKLRDLPLNRWNVDTSTSLLATRVARGNSSSPALTGGQTRWRSTTPNERGGRSAAHRPKLEWSPGGGTDRISWAAFREGYGLGGAWLWASRGVRPSFCTTRARYSRRA